MQIQVEYFAGARDLAEAPSETITVHGDSPRLSSLLQQLAAQHPRLAPLLPRMRTAQNGEFTRGDPALNDGDEVAVLPPVAGGSGGSGDGDAVDPVALCEVWDRPLSVDDTLAAVEHAGAGGVAVFIGVVRDHADGKSVSRLDYESHPTLAPKEMRRVLQTVAAEQPGVRLAAIHRVGQLGIGDRAVVVTASAPHRAQAFSACRDAIDRIKETVPVWKREWDTEGQPNWVNLEE